MVLGKKDPVLNYEDSLSQIEDTTVELISFEDGHMSHIENKEELKPILQEFFNK
ncbi:hypothetical protein D3C86_2047500 [compost metagenome]